MSEIEVLDHGFVKLVDHMGDDSAIAQAARVSYGAGTKSVSEDKTLIRYLLRHKHTTPFEMVEFKFHVKLPIFVARQWIRHRTGSFNEYSARYSIVEDKSYNPDPNQIQPQSTTNKQGRAGEITDDGKDHVMMVIEDNAKNTYANYEELITPRDIEGYDEHYPGLARELARVVLPVSYYTQWYWKVNLHNLFHFLKLRMDKHAQYEIRVYAEAIYKIIQPIVPIACEAFEDYINSAYTCSRQEIEIIRWFIGRLNDFDYGNINDRILRLANENGLTKRETAEFISKFWYSPEED